MLKTFWKTLKTVVIGVGLVLSFFAGIELLRAYETLHEIHVVVGNIFLLFLCCGLFWIVGHFIITAALRPPVLKPPAITDPYNPSHRELHRYGKHLVKYIGRLAINKSLSLEERGVANNGKKELAVFLRNRKDDADLLSAIEKAEQQTVKPLLAKLDQQAEKQVRDSTRDVMAAVAFSPYKSIDVIVVIYRNFLMISRVVKVYNNRPRMREFIQVLSDVVNVVAAVNYLNMGQDLLEKLGSNVPLAGKYMDDIAQGIGAGFMTSVAGHTTIHRCQAFKSWNVTEAKASIRTLLGTFYSDVRNMFFKDILPQIKHRLGDVSLKQWENIVTGVGSALDETGKVVSRFVKEPFVNAGNSDGKAGTTNGRAVLKTAGNVGTTIARKTKKASDSIFRGGKTAGDKIVAACKNRVNQPKE